MRGLIDRLYGWAQHPLLLLFTFASVVSAFDLFRLHNAIYHVSLGPITFLALTISKVAFGILILACLSVLYKTRPLRMPTHVSLFCALITYAAVLGLWNIHNQMDMMDFEAYTSHAISFFGIFIGFWAGSIVKLDMEKIPYKRLDQLAYAAVFAHAIVVCGAVVLQVPQGVTCLSASGIACWFLMRDKKVWLSVETLIVLLSGKRSVLLSLIVGVLLLSIFLRYYKPALTRWVFSMVTTLMIVTAIGVSLNSQGTFDGINLLQKPFSRISFMIENAEGGDASKASAGRSDELVKTWEFYGPDRVRIAAGAGLGWWYPFYDMKDEEGNNFRRHYTHFSPAVFLYTFGVFGCIVLIGMLTTAIRPIAKVTRDYISKEPVILVIMCYVIARFFEGLFGSTWHTDATNWFLFGYLTSYAIPRALKARAPLPLAPQPASP